MKLFGSATSARISSLLQPVSAQTLLRRSSFSARIFRENSLSPSTSISSSLKSTVSFGLSLKVYTVTLCPASQSVSLTSPVSGFLATIWTLPSVMMTEGLPSSSQNTYPEVPRMPTVIVVVLISNDSSSESFSVTSKNRPPLVSLSSSFLFFFLNSARLSFWSVTIFVSSSPTEASPSAPVFSASPLWKRILSMTGFWLPLPSSILTVPSTRRSRIVVAVYPPLFSRRQIITIAAMTTTITLERMIFVFSDNPLILSISTIRCTLYPILSMTPLFYYKSTCK